MANRAFETLKSIVPSISVGMLTADLLNLGRDIALLEQTDVKLLHFDVMDGCFCPSTTIGPPLIKAVNTSMLKDVHLMIANPLTKLGDYAAAGADIITVHLESCPDHIHRIFQELAKMTNTNDPDRGIVRGVAINPGTPVESIEPLLDDIEMVTVLSINPGWGGQKFGKSTSERLARMRKMISNRDILLCVDGGITKDNISDIAKMDVDLVVTGSAVFDGKAPVANAEFMLGALRNL